jgi:hypothetical protein
MKSKIADLFNKLQNKEKEIFSEAKEFFSPVIGNNPIRIKIEGKLYEMPR